MTPTQLLLLPDMGTEKRMNWPELPIYTEAEAIEYAEGCAQRWLSALQARRPLTHEEWEAVHPPDMLAIPGQYWTVVHAVFEQCCGLRADAATVQWWHWGQRWFGRSRTWIEQLEEELRAYDEVLAEFTDAELRGAGSEGG